jgi:acyl carrier protein
MKTTDFFSELKEAVNYDADDISQSTTIHLTSLSTLSIIALVDEHFNIQINADDLRCISNVGDLMNIIGLNKFE